MPKNKQSSLRTIDLFCGAGGSSYGARNAGAEIIAGFDIWNTAALAYKTNFPSAKVFEGDLRDLDPNSVKRQLGEIDLILASPECTNHSLAKGAKERCEESKMTAFQVTRYAETFQPKWIVIENVVEMQSWSEHQKLLEELWRLDYFVKEVKLNSADFNVPQARKRLFLLCTKAKNISCPIGNSPRRPVADIIDNSNLYKFTPLFQQGRAENTIVRAENAIKALGKNEKFIMVYYGTGDGWQPLNKPLRTITTLDRFALVKPTRKHGHEMRMLQPEELKLAMGFDHDYKLNIGVTEERK
jgi:DNA (cytosine-5)-methyltransferase 1